MPQPIIFVLMVAAFWFSLTDRATAANLCPFCSAVNMTMSEQLDSNDVVVVAKLLEVPPPSDDPDADFPKAEFEIVQVIKGQDFVAAKMKFRTQLVGSYPAGQKFLVMGVDPPKLAWTTPMKASDRVFAYLDDVKSLPATGPKRLEFFQDYFEDQESILAFDAYDEFAKAPYADLIALKDQMQHDKLVGWIKDPETSVNRRRLYFTMLGVCGTEVDVKMLEELIRSGEGNKMGLDALIASYLTLAGERGVDLIEEKYLADPDSEYVDANAAVSALRFHGAELKLISKERMVSAIRNLLDRPKMADMIIPDLARWEDWSVMERLVQMFKDADADSNWLRVPVISYLRACPKPEAKTYIAELGKIDPDAVRRADFFLGGFGDDEEDSETEAKPTDTVEPANPTDDSSDSESSDESSESPTSFNSSNGLGGQEQVNSERESFVSNVSTAVSEEHVVKKVPALDVSTTDPIAAAEAIIPSARLQDNKIEVPVSAQKTATKSALATNQSNSTFVSSSAADTVNVAAGVVPQVAGSNPVAAVTSPSLTWSIIFVPMGISLVIFLLLWSVVNGWFERLIF